MVFFALVAALFAGYGTAYLASEDVRYLTRAGFEETRILQSRQPIARLVRDSAIDPALRQTLGLVLQTRDYAARLGLEPKRLHVLLRLGPGHLLLRLQAAPKDCICPYTWRYPSSGRNRTRGLQSRAPRKRGTVPPRGNNLFPLPGFLPWGFKEPSSPGLSGNG